MSGILRFYIDGALAYERLGVIMNTSTLPLQFAGQVCSEYPGGNNASDGFLDLDELRFYNVPLSSEDVLALANASDGGVGDQNQDPGAPIGIAIAETSNPAVFTVEQGSFATAPIPPRFYIDGGQWRRTNRGASAFLALSFNSNNASAILRWLWHVYFTLNALAPALLFRRHARRTDVQLCEDVATRALMLE